LLEQSGRKRFRDGTDFKNGIAIDANIGIGAQFPAAKNLAAMFVYKANNHAGAFLFHLDKIAEEFCGVWRWRIRVLSRDKPHWKQDSSGEKDQKTGIEF